MDYQFGVTAIPDINDDGTEDVIAGARYGNFYCINGKGDSLLFMHSFPGDWLYTVNKMPSIDGNFSYEILAGTKNGKVVCFSGGTVAVPVELTAFTGYERNGKVALNWSTATETNNYGFEIEKRASLNPSKGGTSGSWEKIGFVQGSGTTTELCSYSYFDENISAGTFCYRLKQIDFNGKYEYSEVVEVEVGTPNEYALEQNYPNPFNPTTTISYSLREKGLVSLKVFDILGNEVKTILSEEQEAGNYQIEFSATGGSASGGDAHSLASGIYFYTLKAVDPESSSGQGFVSTRKMILLK
jgi:hypothetical protein